jgi:AcrR family transcriptional regulator
VPSENAVVDRRGRKRAARRDALLDLAGDLVAAGGVHALTMTSLAQAADYAPASLYTYFPSRSALIATLQEQALLRLAAAARTAVERWDDDLRALGTGTDDPGGALARLWAFNDLLVRAPAEHPRDFALQQELLVASDAETDDDAARVVPSAMAVLDVPRTLLLRAAGAGAITNEADEQVGRTLAWVAAINGALLAGRVRSGLAVGPTSLAESISRSMLVGWGAPIDLVDSARVLALRWQDGTGTQPEETP